MRVQSCFQWNLMCSCHSFHWLQILSCLREHYRLLLRLLYICLQAPLYMFIYIYLDMKYRIKWTSASLQLKYHTPSWFKEVAGSLEVFYCSFFQACYKKIYKATSEGQGKFHFGRLISAHLPEEEKKKKRNEELA